MPAQVHLDRELKYVAKALPPSDVEDTGTTAAAAAAAAYQELTHVYVSA